MSFNPQINDETVYDVRKLRVIIIARRAVEKKKRKKKKKEKWIISWYPVTTEGHHEGKQIINSLLISAWYKKQAAKSLVKSIITGDKFTLYKFN